jgi:ribonuclease HI
MSSFLAYTDGACDPNPGPGGWAAIVCHNGCETEIVGSGKGTNNRFELIAIIEALRYAGKSAVIEIRSDSKYAVNAIGSWKSGNPTLPGWMVKWEASGWMKKGKRGKLETVMNADLMKQLFKLAVGCASLKMVWVRGHNGDPMNERADQLAVMAMLENVGAMEPNHFLGMAI